MKNLSANPTEQVKVKIDRTVELVGLFKDSWILPRFCFEAQVLWTGAWPREPELDSCAQAGC